MTDKEMLEKLLDSAGIEYFYDETIQGYSFELTGQDYYRFRFTKEGKSVEEYYD